MNPTIARGKQFWNRNYFGFASAVLLTMAGLPAFAAPLAKTNETHVAKLSVFIQPANPSEGRDPFFPGSMRPYASTVAPSAPTTDLGSLVMQGTSGTPDHRLVIINNVTFGVGDDADVTTPQGRIRIHCLEIGDDSTVIEAAGQRQVLYYRPKT
jgi:hypothetical protein